MLAEVPTVAGEIVYMYNNTSVIHDEVLSARLGLVPLTGNPDVFDRMSWRAMPNAETGSEGDDALDSNTIVFRLHKRCTLNEKAPAGAHEPLQLYLDADVHARDLEWVPQGHQLEDFGDDPPRPANPDILLAKLRPGQAVELEMHCVKGVGADHAKFSPVATATYRLHPTIDILRPIFGEDARLFKSCFAPGVIGIEKVTEDDAQRDPEYVGAVGEDKAVVRNAFKDTVSRECMRHEQFNGRVRLGRIRDHFIFGVESTGQFPADQLFLKSVRILKHKCDALLTDLDRLEHH